MNARSTSLALLAALGALLVADVVVHVAVRPPAPIASAALPGFDAALADRITIGRTDEALVLEKRPDGWWIAAPTAGRANQGAVEAMLGVLSPGVTPEARVGEGELDRYGLSGGNELRVDVEGSDQALLTLYLGHDAGGGSTWVRWGGADAVYRARIGGRATFDRGPLALRDLEVTRLDPRSLSEVAVLQGRRRLVLRPTDTGWAHPWRPLDAPTLNRLVGTLAGMLALEVAAPGEVAGDLSVRLTSDGNSVVLTFEQVGELWFVGRSDSDERWRIRPEVPEILRQAPASLADRHLWARSRHEVVGIEQRVGRQRATLERAGEVWVRTAPTPLDVDPQRAQAAGVWLTGPRVTHWAEGQRAAELGFPGTERWQVRFANGRSRTLELGGRATVDGQDHVAVRDRAKPTKVGFVDARIIAGIRGLFAD